MNCLSDWHSPLKAPSPECSGGGPDSIRSPYAATSRGTRTSTIPATDELADGPAAVADQLRRRLPRDLTDAAQNLFTNLSVAGVGKHRLWLVTASPRYQEAIGTTPRAASALHEAVRKYQRNDPLFCVYVDAAMHAQCPPLLEALN